MKIRMLIMFLIVSLLLAMFVYVGPTTVYAETGDTEATEPSSETLGDTLQDNEAIFGFEDAEYLNGPLGKILAGLLFVFAAVINAIGAVIGTVITLILGIGAFLWGIVEFFVGLFR